MEYSYPDGDCYCVGGWFQSKAYQHACLKYSNVVHHKKSTKNSNIFSNSTPDPMKSTPVTGRGTYIGHAELSYHGPCHAFHLLQVTTSTWHCLMHDSTLKLINFVFSVFWFWLQIFHEFPMRLDISVGIFEGPLILRHTSSIHSHFGELFTSRRPQKKNTHMTWHRP